MPTSNFLYIPQSQFRIVLGTATRLADKHKLLGYNQVRPRTLSLYLTLRRVYEYVDKQATMASNTDYQAHADNIFTLMQKLRKCEEICDYTNRSVNVDRT